MIQAYIRKQIFVHFIQEVKKAVFKSRPLLIILEILIVFGLTIIADRFLGLYFDRSMFFKAYEPGQTSNYESSEYKFKAIISSQGLRSAVVDRKKKTGVLRILALGDSMTWGWGVDEDKSWPKQLEKMMRDAGRRVQVINAGIYGGDLWSENKVCQFYINQFKPDMVVLGFNSSDDLFNNLSEYEKNKTYIDFGPRFPDNITGALWPNLVKLKQERYVISPGGPDEEGDFYVRVKWKKIVHAVGNDKNLLNNLSPRVRDDFTNFKISPFLVLAAQKEPRFLTFILNEGSLSDSLRATDKLFSVFKRCTESLPVTVVFIPSEELVAEEYHKNRKEIGFDVDAKLLSFDFDEKLSPIVTKHGFSFVSLLSDFRNDKCLACYYPYDSHMTEVGQLKVAQKILEMLK